MPSYPSEQEFLQEFARALLAWQRVEEALLRIFTSLIAPKDADVLFAAYFAVTSLEVRRNMIDAAADVALLEGRKRKALRRKWTTLSNKVKSKSKRRNALAHYGLVPATDTFEPQLGPIFNARYTPLGEARTYGISDLRDFRSSFHHLAERLQQFALLLFFEMRPTSPRKRPSRQGRK